MSEETILQILMRRDKLTQEEASEVYREGALEINAAIAACDVEGAYSAIEEHFGLEPDYLDEFLYPQI